MTANCWLGRSFRVSTLSSMRLAKLPALLRSKSPAVVEEFIKLVAEVVGLVAPIAVKPVTSCANKGGVVPVTPAGHPVPFGVQPFARFCCMIRNDGTIGSAFI